MNHVKQFKTNEKSRKKRVLFHLVTTQVRFTMYRVMQTVVRYNRKSYELKDHFLTRV
jgi:hypothetical protein